MPVITGIIQAARIAYIGYKVGKIVYKGVKYSKPAAQWLGRHPKIARYGTIAASSAPIIYDLLNVDYSAIQIPKFPQTNKVRQTRDTMEQSRTGRRKRYCYSPRKGYGLRR